MPWIETDIGHAPSQAPARGGDGLVAPSALAYRGAGYTEKTLAAWERRNYSIDAAILPYKRTLEGGVGDLVRNNGYVVGARQTMVDNIIGPKGLRLSAKPDWRALGWTEERAQDWAADVESRFRRYANDPAACDAAGVMDFADQQTAHYFNVFEFGESLALPVWLPDRPGAASATCFMGVQPARLRNPLGKPDAPNFRAGIETNEYGAPIRYHIAKRNPDDTGTFANWQERYLTEAVDARTAWARKRVIHLMRRTAFGQTRGVSPIAPLLAQFKQLDLFHDYVMKQQILACLVGLIIETPGEDLIAAFGGTSQSEAEAAIQYLDGRQPPDFNGGGQVLNLKVGEKAVPVSANVQGAQIDAFVDAFMQELQAGTNLPHELLTKNFSKSSYVGIRAGLAEASRFFTSDRIWMATGFCDDFYQLWLEEEVNAGRIEAPGFYDNIAAYTGAKWLGARYSFTDRLKEVTASVLAIENNLSTLEEEISFSLGEDWRDVLAQRKRELQVCGAYGLPLVAGPVAIAAASAPQTDGGADAAPSPAPSRKKAEAL